MASNRAQYFVSISLRCLRVYCNVENVLQQLYIGSVYHTEYYEVPLHDFKIQTTVEAQIRFTFPLPPISFRNVNQLLSYFEKAKI